MAPETETHMITSGHANWWDDFVARALLPGQTRKQSTAIDTRLQLQSHIENGSPQAVQQAKQSQGTPSPCVLDPRGVHPHTQVAQ